MATQQQLQDLYDRLGRIGMRLKDSGMTHRQVAEIMETSPENARRRYLRAKMRARYNVRSSTESELLECENRWVAFFASPRTVDLAVEDLDLSERPRNCLKRARIDTVTQLLAKDEDDLLCITNLGQRSLDEIVEQLNKRGLSLRPRVYRRGRSLTVVAPPNWRIDDA